MMVEPGITEPTNGYCFEQSGEEDRKVCQPRMRRDESNQWIDER